MSAAPSPVSTRLPRRATRVVAARLPYALYDRVAELAEAAGVTRGEFIREVVADALEALDREGGE